MDASHDNDAPDVLEVAESLSRSVAAPADARIAAMLYLGSLVGPERYMWLEDFLNVPGGSA